MVEVSQDKFGRVGDISSSLFSCLYVVYGGGGVCSGVNVNQDVNKLWELCGKVESAEGDGQALGVSAALLLSVDDR